MFQEKDMSVGAWFAFYILSVIPFVNFVVWLVLLLGSKTNKSLKNLLVLQVPQQKIIMILIGVQ